MIIIYGTRCYGTIDAEDGTQHATRFAHIYYLPLFPVSGFQLVGNDMGRAIPMSGKSVLLGYVRVWGFFALGGLIASAYLSLEQSFVSGAIASAVALAGIAAWAVSMLKIGVTRKLSPAAYGLTLGIPLLALGVAIFTGAAERTRRMRYDKEDFGQTALLNFAKKELEQEKKKKTVEPGVEGYRSKCDQGSAGDCNELGYALRDTDPTASLAAYTKGCDGDNGMACFNEALVVQKTDEASAVMLYEQACELKYADGCNNLALRTEKTDLAKAVALYTKGCDLKSGLACRNLGRMTELGRGVKKNAKQAKALFKQACELGDQTGCSKQ